MMEFTCIGCPMGCALKVQLCGGEIAVSGNQCRRGDEYARSEALHPVRSIASTVPIAGAAIPRLPVRTAGEIPKERIFACMAEIRKIRARAPVSIGDVLLEDCAGTGVKIIACRNIPAAE